MGKKVPAEVLSSLNSIDEPSRLVDTMAAHMALKIEQKQDILEITDLSSRVEHVLALLDAEIDLLQVEKAYPRPGQEADGAQPARVLPE
ncbi:LON peptidase substrate-binding domain-containing protein [Pseudomonas aeruginosa]|nr:LON peptidase substrate-binding domain-containing protein [Pseudomonas aeruginosa]